MFVLSGLLPAFHGIYSHKHFRISLKTVNSFPTRTGKPGKMGRHFPVRESQGILNRLESLEKSGNFRQILFIIF